MLESVVKERIDKITTDAVAANTVTGYESGIKHFWAWAWITKQLKRSYPVSPEVLAAYVLENIEGFDPRTDGIMAEFGYKKRPGRLAIATIRHRVEAIGWKHRAQNLPNPARSEHIRDLLRSAQRIESKAGRVPKKSLPITQEILKKLLKSIRPYTLIGKRNRAILVFGFYTGGRRRSEIATAEYRFLTEYQGGYKYLLHRSKTDQAGKGSTKRLSRQRAAPMRTWLKASGIKDGYLFRRIFNDKASERPISGDLVNSIVKDHIEAIGLNPKRYSAHGLRRGFVTTCARQGFNIWDIMRATGHKDIKTVQGYCEEVEADKNPVNRL